jgi:protein gp37
MTALIPRSAAASMTGIEWTDFTANPWIGCTRMPASSGARSGCELCYAETFAVNRMGVIWGAGAERRPVSSFETRMHRLDRLAAATGLHFSVFALSLGDWLDPEVDPTRRAKFADTVDATPNLNWLLLTHRPHLAAKLAPAHWRQALPAHVWPGVTVEHRLHARRWDELAEHWGDTGRAWVSAEPLASSLAGIGFTGAATIIAGGASNTNDPTWALDLRWIDELVDQHGEDKIFFKQHGSFLNGRYVGKKAAGRELHGRIFDNTAWPRHRELLAAAAQRKAA